MANPPITSQRLSRDNVQRWISEDGLRHRNDGPAVVALHQRFQQEMEIGWYLRGEPARLMYQFLGYKTLVINA